MEKKFQTVGVERIARWVFDALEKEEIMGLPRSSVRFPDARLTTECCGKSLAIPLGVAAGPHTQLAQNIVSAWLCGARFIELKTVQMLDQIEVPRPCIDSADLTFNCEWSQELTLDESFEEYIGAWVLIHALAHKLNQPPGVIFNMSVGYDLKGIQSDKVQRFIRRMRDASAEMPRVIDAVARVVSWVREVPIPTHMSSLVTLSTMHGCPPSEIERIASYFLDDLAIDTWVKLNPTLLGPDLLRGILNATLGHDVVVEDAAFEHDPKFDDAMKMVSNLADLARRKGRCFGVKLTNTLEVSNRRRVFPPKEKSMYMSGRALHPLTVTLAHKVTEALDGRVPISFCGGADAFNYPTLVADGVYPVTTCTDLLKPGGYARLAQYVDNLTSCLDRLEASSIEDFIRKQAGAPTGANVQQLARENLERHALQVLADRRWRARIKPLDTKGRRKLEPFDCIEAPCQEACPTHQDIPDYMRFVAEGSPQAALDVIVQTNALPAITGRVCDHPCVRQCVRNHYETPLAIRAIKRHAVDHGPKPNASRKLTGSLHVAIVGAGPMGLSAAYYLALAGVNVTIFETKQAPGGMASSVIPRYRLPDEPIALDMERVQQLGVQFEFGVRVGKDLSLDEIRSRGFDNIVLAAGAQEGRRLQIEGQDAQGVYDALDFLDAVRRDKLPRIGPNVLVVGGGNSAMDAARTAVRLVGKQGKVTVVYRRMMEQMPADPDEIEACLTEGVVIEPLRAPLRVQHANGRITHLVCGHMKLGEVDSSGRPRPVPIEGMESAIECDTLIVGISQQAVLDFLGSETPQFAKDGSIVIDPDTCETSIMGLFAGGDLARGPSSIIQAVADGRRVARCICERNGIADSVVAPRPHKLSKAELMARRSVRVEPEQVPEFSLDKDNVFGEVEGPYGLDEAVREANRCLACHTLCSLCVTVCPNRANQTYELTPFSVELPVLTVRDGQLLVDSTERFALDQPYQVVNIADFCNECGNCTTFCPTSGRPYGDKPRIHLSRKDYESAWYDTYYLEANNGTLTVWRRTGQPQDQASSSASANTAVALPPDTYLATEHCLTLGADKVLYDGQGVVVRFDAKNNHFVEAQPKGALPDGARIDLSVAMQMLAFAKALPVVPV